MSGDYKINKSDDLTILLGDFYSLIYSLQCDITESIEANDDDLLSFINLLSDPLINYLTE